MLNTIVNQLRKSLTGTPLESVARRVYLTFGRSQGIQYERELMQVMRRVLTPTSNCIDVGAYRGGVLQEIIRLAPRGTHFAFEPVPAQCAYLQQSFPAARVQQLAISDIVEETTFHHVTSRPTYSGLRQVQYPSEQEQVDLIRVQTQTLDNIIPSDVPIHFIKIDVEGAEFHVVNGGTATIARSKPVIVFEHGLTSPYFYEKTSFDLYDLLTEACGLRVSLMAHWLMDGPPLSRAAFSDEVSGARNFYFVAHP